MYVIIKKTAKSYVCKHAGRPSLSVDPDKKKVDIVHTEAPSSRGGSCHTRRHSRRPSLQNERRRNDTSLSDRGSYILRETRNTKRWLQTKNKLN